MNVAANLLMEDSKVEIQEIGLILFNLAIAAAHFIERTFVM